ncbi:MAG: hypothetical protein HYV60_14960 [Planctomycetia bacterium]|nr:hypothetical protein [Planctomycetia bacterium]
MLILGTLSDAKIKVWTDAQHLIQQLRTICATSVSNVEQAISLLMQLREETAEDINQIQHEHMILVAAEWLVQGKRCAADTVWDWNPRQTGGADEPDLRGHTTTKVIISAEITTSLEPQGVIDSRMSKTLRKLSVMPGDRYYFVRTDTMAARARTKIRKNGYEIEVVRVPT